MTAKKFNKILSIALIVTILGGLAGYYISRESLAVKISEYSDKIAEETVQKDLGEQLELLRKEFTNTAEGIEIINAVLPNEKLQSEVLAQINDIARRVGIELSTVRFESTSNLPSTFSQTSETSVSGALALPLTFRTTGSYAQLQSFLIEIENLQRSTQVSSLDVSQSTSADGKDTLTFNMILDIHLQDVIVKKPGGS